MGLTAQKVTYDPCLWYSKEPCFKEFAEQINATEDLSLQLQVCILCQLRKLNREVYKSSNGSSR